MFKFPTTKEIGQSAVKTFTRFPLAISIMLFATIYSIVLIHSDLNENQDKLIFLIYVLINASFWSLSLDIISEIKQKEKTFRIISNFILIGFIIGFYFLFNNFDADKVIYRLFIISLLTILLFLSIPYFTKAKQLDYWDYNRTIFYRFSLTFIYSAVIYIGTSVALLIINWLFKTELGDKIFFDIWVIIVGIFAFWMFVAGVPNNFYLKTDEEYEYPKFLKILVQIIYLPLVTIYMLILYVYSAKILITWELPEGGVSYLVLVFSGLGILGLMLIYPVRNNQNNKWISTFAKLFYWAVLPLIILLFVAIFRRISDYGITENRYFVLVFALWLAGISIYMLISKNKDIKIITFSLSALLLIAGFGPWSAFNVAKISQFKRLNNLLIENKIVVDGKINYDSKILDYDEYYELSDLFSYYINNHGEEIIEKEYGLDIPSENRYDLVYKLMDTLNLQPGPYEGEGSEYSYYHYTYEENLTNVSKYDYYCYFEKYYSNLFNPVVINDSLTLMIEENEENLLIKLNTEEQLFSLNDYQKKLAEKYPNSYSQTISKEDAYHTFKFKNYEVLLIINYFKIYKSQDTTTYNWIKGSILVDDLNL